MIPDKESITVEFKSDRGRLSDKELLATVVSLANTEGGEVYLGVEDDGTPTGLHPEHRDVTSLAAFIANRTNPSIQVRVELIEIRQIVIAKISVPKTRHLVATSEGLLQRRRLKADGTLKLSLFIHMSSSSGKPLLVFWITQLLRSAMPPLMILTPLSDKG